MMWPDHNEIPLHTNLFGRKLNLFLSFFAWANSRLYCVQFATVVIHETGDFDIGIKNLEYWFACTDCTWQLPAIGYGKFNNSVVFAPLSRPICRADNKIYSIKSLDNCYLFECVISVRSIGTTAGKEKKTQKDISRAISWKSMKILGKWWSRFKSRNLWSPIRRGVFDQHIENAHIFPARKMR